MDSEGGKELCCHNSLGQSVESPFFWFKAVKEKKCISTIPSTSMPLHISNSPPSELQMNEWLSASETVRILDQLFINEAKIVSS